MLFRIPPRNPGAIGDLSLLRDRMHSLARLHSAACGWRVPEEAADQIYDEVVDRVLREDLPVDLVAWARSALIKLLFRGPKRCEPGRRIRGIACVFCSTPFPPIVSPFPDWSRLRWPEVIPRPSEASLQAMAAALLLLAALLLAPIGV